MVEILTQFNKKEVLDAYPKKVKIVGAHTDVNRMLVDRGMKAIYSDKDETHHKGDYMTEIKASSIVAKKKKDASQTKGEPSYKNEKDQNVSKMKAEMRGQGVNPNDYDFEEEKPDDKDSENLTIALIEKLEEVKNLLKSSKLPGEIKESTQEQIDKVEKQIKQPEP